MIRSTLWKIFKIKESTSQRIIHKLPQWISPNLLTTMRIVLTIPVVWLIMADQYSWALALFLLAFVFDFFDGPLARAQGTISDFGKLYDPFADKVAFIGVLVVAGFDQLPTSLVWTIIILEGFLVTIALSFKLLPGHRRTNRQLGANIFGKLKMSIQVVGAVILLLNWTSATGQMILELVFWVAIIFAVLSIIGHLTPSIEKGRSQDA